MGDGTVVRRAHKDTGSVGDMFSLGWLYHFGFNTIQAKGLVQSMKIASFGLPWPVAAFCSANFYISIKEFIGNRDDSLGIFL